MPLIGTALVEWVAKAVAQCDLYKEYKNWEVQVLFCFPEKWKWKSLSRVWLFATPCTIQSMEFSRPEYWSGYPFPSPGNLPNPGIEPRSPTLQADTLPAEPQGSSRILEWIAYPFSRGIFPAQESKWCIVHCRQILYQLSYQESPWMQGHPSKGYKNYCSYMIQSQFQKYPLKRKT